MKARIVDADVLSSVSPSALHAYLVAQEWRKEGGYRDVGHIYSKSGFGELIVPNSSKFPDYASVIREIVSALSKSEDRDELQVIRDLTVSDVDVIRIRIPEASPDGSVQFDKGVELVSQSKELLLSAACAAIEPKRSYYAGKVVKAVDYMRDVRMGQTEIGSFILTLLSPVPPTMEGAAQMKFWPELSEEPFSRQVTRRLSIALLELNRAIENVNAGSGIDAFEQAVPAGVSSNLCEAAANLIDQGEGLDVAVTWARIRQGPSPIERHSFVAKDKEILREVARILKDKEPRNSEQLEGFVEKLSRPTDIRVGQVTIKAPIDGKLTSISVFFEPEEYSNIVAAHDQRRSIRVEGDLIRERQRWRLLKPRGLVISSDSD